MSLSKERHNAKLSQSQLAKKSKVNIRMVQYYEQGYKNINTAQPLTLYRLANALETPVHKIVTDKELIKEIKKERKL